MRRYFFPLCLLALLLLANTKTNAQWEHINLGPVGGKVNAVLALGPDVFAGTQAGINRSTNYGATWTSITTNFTFCFATIDSNIFAGTGTGVIFSTDRGKNWTSPDSSMNYYTTCLAVSDTVIFAGTHQNGIFRSTNMGVSWTAVDSGLGDFQGLVIAFAVKGDTIFAGTVSGLCFSTNNGNSWNTINTPPLLSSQVVNCVAAKDSLIFVGTPGDVFRSTDNGYIWETADSGLSFGTSIFSILINNSNPKGGQSGIFIGTTASVYISTDNGANWTSSNNGLPPKQVYSIAESSNATGGTNLYAATNNGVYLSTNNGAGWTAKNNGSVGTEVYFLVGRGSKIFALINNSPIFVSTDYGRTWKAAADSGGLITNSITSLTVTDSALYTSNYDKGIYKSSNNGENWVTINGGVMDTLHPFGIVQSGPNLVVSTGKNGIYFSSDDGTDWEIPSGNIPKAVSYPSVIGSNIIVEFANGMYLSKDNGKNWTQLNDFSSGGSFIGIVSTGSTLFTAIEPNPAIGSTTPPSGVLRSFDDGKTWAYDTSLSTDNADISLAVHNSDIFAGLGGNLYVSKNNGNSWNKLDGFLHDGINYVFVNDSSIFAGNYQGIWHMPLPDTISSIKQAVSSSLPRSFKLLQNYPNPFNPSTIISYQLSVLSHVKLDVYNVLGQKVVELVNKEEPAGTYKVTFNAGNLASGVYFYRLKTKNFVETKKCVLLK